MTIDIQGRPRLLKSPFVYLSKVLVKERRVSDLLLSDWKEFLKYRQRERGLDSSSGSIVGSLCSSVSHGVIVQPMMSVAGYMVYNHAPSSVTSGSMCLPSPIS